MPGAQEWGQTGAVLENISTVVSFEFLSQATQSLSTGLVAFSNGEAWSRHMAGRMGAGLEKSWDGRMAPVGMLNGSDVA